MKKIFIVLVSLSIAFAIFACSKKKKQVTIQVKYGDVVIELFEKDAPKASANFIKLAEEGFYDGLIFHRVVAGETVQGGDPRGDGSGGPGYTVKYESTGRRHEKGAIAMLKKNQKDNNGSIFYICVKPQYHLDGKFTVFGRVVSGLDVVAKIKRGDIMKKIFVSSK